MVEERPIPRPSGTITDITRIRRTMANRKRNEYPSVNFPEQDTIPGADSKGETA